MLLLLPASCGLVRQRLPFLEETSRAERLEGFLEESFSARLDRDPLAAAWIGDRRHPGRWSDLSPEAARREAELARRERARLRDDFPAGELEGEPPTSRELFERQASEALTRQAWRTHVYLVEQAEGWHLRVPRTLLHAHDLGDEDGLRAWIARVRAVPGLFAQLEAGLSERAELRVLPPRFVFPLVLEQCRRILAGDPFTEGARPSVLLSHFERALDLAGLAPERREALLAEARGALVDALLPAYESLMRLFGELELLANVEDGIWKLPSGGAFYAHELRRATSLAADPTALHAFALGEVGRLQDELRVVARELGQASLDELLAELRSSPSSSFPSGDAGRAAFLESARSALAEVQPQLAELFLTLPRAPLALGQDAPFASRALAHPLYVPAPLEGRARARLFFDLERAGEARPWHARVLARRDGLPGRHLQAAVAAQQRNLPRARRHADVPAFVEGWALYAAGLAGEPAPREEDERAPERDADPRPPAAEPPAPDGTTSAPSEPSLASGGATRARLAQLALELWHACLLVVDTGIHDRRWTREEGIAYVQRNAPWPASACVEAVERVVVLPGRAAAAPVGAAKLRELAERAASALGPRYDARELHELVLGGGPLPLDLLEARVLAWIADWRG